jgi:hypothetical protein
MLESAIVTYHSRLISATKGNPASVEFDFDAVWRFKKQNAAGWSPKYLRWVHVHPIGFGTGPSMQDQICAASLAAAFKEVDRFGIACFYDCKPDNIQGDIRWYEWNKGKQCLVPDNNLCDIMFSLDDREAYILKTLSFGDLWKSKASPSTDSEPSAPISSSS